MSSDEDRPPSRLVRTSVGEGDGALSITAEVDRMRGRGTSLRIGLAGFAAVLTLLLLFPSGLSRAYDSGPDNLLVYGSGFLFSVREPRNWKADTKAASEYRANILFYRQGETARKARALIVVNVATKIDENTAADLKYDMSSYRRRYPGIIFKDIDVSSPHYESFAKLFCLPGKFYEYVTYLNPAPASRLLLSVSMNKQTQAAAPEELAAYRSVIGSLTLLRPGATQTRAR